MFKKMLKFLCVVLLLLFIAAALFKRIIDHEVRVVTPLPMTTEGVDLTRPLIRISFRTSCRPQVNHKTLI